MPKYKKNRKRFDDINVIPFIDIMLVLLVMVLTTATFVNQGIIPVDLPKAQAAKKEQNDDKKETNIYINSKGEIFIEKEAVSPKELERRLSQIPKEQNIVLRSDKDSRFQDFVSVMDTLKRLDHDQLYIITKED